MKQPGIAPLYDTEVNVHEVPRLGERIPMRNRDAGGQAQRGGATPVRAAHVTDQVSGRALGDDDGRRGEDALGRDERALVLTGHISRGGSLANRPGLTRHFQQQRIEILAAHQHSDAPLPPG